jgi:cellulose synthase/poly-beta-1,6-N-acetylglucosamine synthase-like glycosyltransferase
VTVTLQNAVVVAVTACFVYLCAVALAFLGVLVLSALEQFRLLRDRRQDDFDALSSSRFTIPVSIVVPAYDEEVVIESTVRSLLALDYPSFEVIVVNDGSRDGTLALLQRAFDLEPREMFFQRRFRSRVVRGAYRSRAHPQLVVVDKENGGKADALNAGLNLARYRYVCTVDGDTVYHRDALLRAMRIPMRDPSTVVGVTSQVAISRRPEAEPTGTPGTSRLDDRLLANFQFLDYLRAFVNNRTGWARWNFMLCSVGSFAVWRRDVVEEMGGFSGDFTCEDIEFTFRVHERFRRERRPYRVVALADSIGRTEGPDTVRSLISQRARWQRVITETVWHYKRMLFNPRYGAVGLVGVPYYLLVEVLAPFFGVLALVVIPVAWWAGILAWDVCLLTMAAIALANGVYASMAVFLFDRESHSYTRRDLCVLVALGALDLFLYRPILIYAQAKGVVEFLRGDKQWNKFERNTRVTPNGTNGANGAVPGRV